ncbi:hypothetical protein B0T26DRAFT_756684 [Lasiosphaeria miniovina]|uniref:Uncharacterized protein n=1 Tax=Lasiosphaeria miniovina TaxID=1954250 RepID=A0AA39ZT22_9PEZI|nr:uncharacterized protein B0T26DRAFT_756684 [Lasiosphaeria miniovina]KAK0703120.1 hypothetical protein B0T26DRAFT_756684 [Lasiosphaeria miniovina]
MRSWMLLAACAPACVAGAFSDFLISQLDNLTVVQSTNSTFWRKVHDQSMCVPSLTEDRVGAIMVLVTEALATDSVAVISPPLAVPAPPLLLLLFSRRGRGADAPGPPPSVPPAGPLLPSSPQVEFPTLFEFLGLDARRKPISPPNACASPHHPYHEEAVKAIRDAALARLQEARSAAGRPGAASWATGERAVLVNSVAGILLDDAARNEYIVVFMPVLARKNLDAIFVAVVIVFLPKPPQYDAIPSPFFDTLHQVLVQHASIPTASMFYVNVTLGIGDDPKSIMFGRLPSHIFWTSQWAGNNTKVLSPVAMELTIHCATLKECLDRLHRNALTFHSLNLGDEVLSSRWLRAGWEYVREVISCFKLMPYTYGYDCRDVNGTTTPASYQECCRTALGHLALPARTFLALDWCEKTEGRLRDLLVNLDTIHSTILAINPLAETLLSLGNPFPRDLERWADDKAKKKFASETRDANRMINIPRGLLHIDQTALLPLTERLGEAYRVLHEQTLPALRQLDRHIADMVAYPIPSIAVDRAGRVVVVGRPPFDQVWVTETARVDGRRRRSVYYLPSNPRIFELLENMEHDLLMIGRHTHPTLLAVAEMGRQDHDLPLSRFDFGEGPEIETGSPPPSQEKVDKWYEEMGDKVTRVFNGKKMIMNQMRAKVRENYENRPVIRELRFLRDYFEAAVWTSAFQAVSDASITSHSMKRAKQALTVFQLTPQHGGISAWHGRTVSSSLSLSSSSSSSSPSSSSSSSSPSSSSLRIQDLGLGPTASSTLILCMDRGSILCDLSHAIFSMSRINVLSISESAEVEAEAEQTVGRAASQRNRLGRKSEIKR